MVADTDKDTTRERGSVLATIRRTLDYMLGRNALIGVASLMLLAISGFATWSGMNDFIVGVSTSPGSQGREIPGGLTVTNNFLVIAIVVALTFLMWLSLRESFRRGKGGAVQRVVTFVLYAFLALWSVGFGYGFWWSLIAGEEATRTSLSGLQEDARDAGQSIAARLDAVRIQLDSVVSWSETQMAREDTSGGSCGVSSGAGRGPLYNARRSVRDGVASIRDNVTNSWIQPVQADLEQLRLSAARLQGETVLERQQNFEAIAADIRGRAKNIAARSNEIGASTAASMNALADAVSIAPGEPGFSCYDPTLAQRLRQAADQSGQPANLTLRTAAFNEGPAGVANAVKNLWANIGAYISAVLAFAASGFQVWPSSSTAAALTGRDLIALLATLGIDVGLFVLTVVNPAPELQKRVPGVVVRQLRDAMNKAIAGAPEVSYEWVHYHLIHHRDKSYFVIPNLYSCDQKNKVEQARAVAMNQLAGVFSDLDLVRWPRAAQPAWRWLGGWWKKSELEELLKEESGDSGTDLAKIRKDRVERLKHEGVELPEELAAKGDHVPLRNHGLFSKAESMMRFAGWSENAVRDPEVFVLVDKDGLTPLLQVLNEGVADAPDRQAREVVETAEKS